MQIAFVASLIFAILISIFAVMNSDTVTIRLLWKQFQFSQAIVILGSATIGALILFLIGAVKDIKKKLKINQLNKKIKELEKRLAKYEDIGVEKPKDSEPLSKPIVDTVLSETEEVEEVENKDYNDDPVKLEK